MQRPHATSDQDGHDRGVYPKQRVERGPEINTRNRNHLEGGPEEQLPTQINEAGRPILEQASGKIRQSKNDDTENTLEDYRSCSPLNDS